MPLILPKSQFLIYQLKKGALTGLPVANPNFSEIASSVEYLHNERILEFSFQTIDESVCSRRMKILVICNSIKTNPSFQIHILRSWGWELTMLGGQFKSIIVAAIVYGPKHGPRHSGNILRERPVLI
jgi:hypothetical protein